MLMNMRKRKSSSEEEAMMMMSSSSNSNRKSTSKRYRNVVFRVLALLTLSFVAFVFVMYYYRGDVDDKTDRISEELKMHQVSKEVVDEAFRNRFTKRDRYLSFVRLDKPVYVAGDTVRARVVLLNEKTFMPYEPQVKEQGGIKKNQRRPFQPPRLTCEMKIFGPKEDEIETVRSGPPKDSTLAISWNIPDYLAGGTYRSVVRCETVAGFPAAERSFEIRSAGSSPPKMNLQIKFDREAYVMFSVFQPLVYPQTHTHTQIW